MGRSDDVIIFSPDHPFRFDFMQYEVMKGEKSASVDNLFGLLKQVIELAEGEKSGNSSDPYWENSRDQLLRNTLTLLVLAGEKMSLDAVMNVVRSAPADLEQVKDTSWMQTSYCAQLLGAAMDRVQTRREQHDYDQVGKFFLKTWAALPEKTRGNIAQMLESFANSLLTGVMWELFASGELNIVPEVAWLANKIIIIDMPVHTWKSTGALAQKIWKLFFFRASTERDVTANPNTAFIACDEVQAVWGWNRRIPGRFGFTWIPRGANQRHAEHK